ncbi:hypothetical protein KIW84_050982 [Lathyrus oleraceus]|uniref:Uncharacterized protein n=1 Tax=Pisum sativum TaxID=3888 RepID=A0A9D4WMV2_PEA|nr:hypothetical protein KIW84_050982 [Pisum sativum]
MSYVELYPSLVLKNLLQPRNPPQIPEPLPWWYKPELCCVFHLGALGHDIENCYPLKYEVQKLVKSGMVSFEDRALNVKANSLPAHGNSSVNMVDGCPGEYKVYDVRHIRQSLVTIHRDICLLSECEHDHDGCEVCSVNPRGCVIIKRDIQRLMDEGLIQVFQSVSPLVIRLAGLVLYVSDKVVPYQYNATMMENFQEVPLPTTNFIVNIVDIAKVTRSGRVFGSVFPKDVEEVTVSKKVDVPVVNSISAPLLQTPSKISVLSLLMNSEAHKVALRRVLEQAYVEHYVNVDQFDYIVDNITSCNSLSFCDEELPEEGRNHNLALLILKNCKDDALSNVLVDTGSSLNILPK